MSHYIFDNAAPQASQRFASLETLYDPWTISHLEPIRITSQRERRPKHEHMEYTLSRCADLQSRRRKPGGGILRCSRPCPRGMKDEGPLPSCFCSIGGMLPEETSSRVSLPAWLSR
jgi:hypothetical protein